MKIKSLRIENFRSFEDQTIDFKDYLCLVGRNGTGKSTVLNALNVFFRQDKDTSTELSQLSEHDFHHDNTERPARITVTFDSLSPEAKRDLSDYVRQGQLTVTAEARYDELIKKAKIIQFGSRLGIQDFSRYFDADKRREKASELKQVFQSLRASYPDLPSAKTKPQMAAALQDYESKHPEECNLIESQDQFYGATHGSNRLSAHLQWVFVPASKNYAEEAEDTKDSVLSQLLTRTAKSATKFSEKISELTQRIELEYENILRSEQGSLHSTSQALQRRLQNWSHPAVKAKVVWNRDLQRSVRVELPTAAVRLGEGGFLGELPRFGHGLQRAYLLALIEELSTTESESQPTLILAIEEPEIYQHPPQIRRLAEVLRSLSKNGSQIICCSHSPHFIPAEDVEAIRVVRDEGHPCKSAVHSIKYEALATRLKSANKKPILKEQGILAKLYPALNPGIGEMFFCHNLILVEGVEDAAHIMAYMELGGLLTTYRQHGCHLIPVGGKSHITKPLALALEFKIPTYVVWDGDQDITKPRDIKMHKEENRSILNLLGKQADRLLAGESGQALWGPNYCMWKTNISRVVKESLGKAWSDAKRQAEERYDHAGRLDKNPIAIAYAHEATWKTESRSKELEALTKSIVNWATLGNLA